MKVRLDPAAKQEIRQAALFCEDCREGLGCEFLDSVESAFERIQQHPTVWRILKGRFRRYLPQRFPDGVIYAVEGEVIYVAAVMHLETQTRLLGHAGQGLGIAAIASAFLCLGSGQGRFFVGRFSREWGQRQFFDKPGDASAVSIGVAEEFDAELSVSAPAHHGDFNGEGRGLLRRVDVQRQIGSRLHRHRALHPATGGRQIEEQAFAGRVVGLDGGWVSHVNSWAAPWLHVGSVPRISIGVGGQDFTAYTFLSPLCIV